MPLNVHTNVNLSRASLELVQKAKQQVTGLHQFEMFCKSVRYKNGLSRYIDCLIQLIYFKVDTRAISRWETIAKLETKLLKQGSHDCNHGSCLSHRCRYVLPPSSACSIDFRAVSLYSEQRRAKIRPGQVYCLG